MTEAQNREKLLEARRVLEAEFDKIPSVLAVAFADVVMITSRVMADLFADVRALKCHRDDLHKANNRYLERARTAERERDAWKARWEKATGQASEQYPVQAARVVEEYAEEYDFRGDGGGYTPTATERVMLIDFGHGLVAEIEDRMRAAAAVAEREPVGTLTTGDLKLLKEGNSVVANPMAVAPHREQVNLYLDPLPTSELEAENARLRQGYDTGCKDCNGKPIYLGDRVRDNNEGPYTKPEYWNAEYEVVFEPPSFVLRHVGGGKKGSNLDFKLKYDGLNGYIEVIEEGPHHAARRIRDGGQADG